MKLASMMKATSMQQRTCKVSLRLSEAERARLFRRAQRSGLGVSEYARRKLFLNENRPIINTDVEALKSLLSDEKRIGGLLNQALKHANMNPAQFSRLATQIEGLLNEMHELNNKISDFINEVKSSV